LSTPSSQFKRLPCFWMLIFFHFPAIHTLTRPTETGGTFTDFSLPICKLGVEVPHYSCPSLMDTLPSVNPSYRDQASGVPLIVFSLFFRKPLPSPPSAISLLPFFQFSIGSWGFLSCTCSPIPPFHAPFYFSEVRSPLPYGRVFFRAARYLLSLVCLRRRLLHRP